MVESVLACRRKGQGALSNSRARRAVIRPLNSPARRCDQTVWLGSHVPLRAIHHDARAVRGGDQWAAKPGIARQTRQTGDRRRVGFRRRPARSGLANITAQAFGRGAEEHVCS